MLTSKLTRVTSLLVRKSPPVERTARQGRLLDRAGRFLTRSGVRGVAPAWAALAVGLVVMPGCGDMMTEFAADSTVRVMTRAVKAFDSESDPWLARNSAVSQLKFAEGVLEASPENKDLLVLLAKNYSLFAFAFLQDDLDQVPFGSAEYDTLRRRAAEFQKRARGYAIRRLKLDFEDADKAVFASGDRFDQILAACTAEDHVGALYFLGYAWSNLIALSPDEPDSLADLPRVRAIMAWVREKAPEFENGGPDLFFAQSELLLSKDQGGDKEVAKAAFEKAIAATTGRYLMAKALYARTYLRAVGDKAGYRQTLQDVLDADENIFPEQRLANTLAKDRAKRWIAQTDKFFE